PSHQNAVPYLERLRPSIRSRRGVGDSVHAPVDSAADQATRVDNQIDVATKSFLGLTVSCARCHDHKFDAISQADYTAIAGLLHATYRVKSYADPGGKRARNRSALNGAADALLNALSVETTASDPTITPPTTAVVVPPRPLDNAQQPRPKQPYALFDFTLGRPDGSVTDGDAFQNPGGQPRAIALHASADGAFHAAPAGWLDSRRSGTAAVGTYHSPPFRIEENRLAIRYVGSGNVRIRLVVDGYYMTDYHNLLFGDTMIRADSKGKWKQHIIAGRLKDYVGRVAHLEVIDEGNGWICVADSRWIPDNAAPGDTANPFADDPATRAATVADAMTRSIQVTELLRSKLQDPATSEIAKRWEQSLQKQVGGTAFLSSVAMQPRNIPLAERGVAGNDGEIIPCGDLTALRQIAIAAAEGNGDESSLAVLDRRAMAKRWTGTSNPLFDRVAVNRVWHYLTGRGIVASCDNFGVLGDTPTHPKLLDHLATRFRNHDRSRKALIRDIVLSRLYQTDSKPRESADAIDVNNLLLHASRVRRVEGEDLRDCLLQLAGRLDRKIGGPSIPIHLTSFMSGRGRPRKSGPLDGQGRRSLFIEVRRNFLSPMMTTFDTPQPGTTVGRRTRSNVPAQALALLNDPLVHDLAAQWANRSDVDGNALQEKTTTDAFIREMYLRAYARSPGDDELQLLRGFLQSDEIPPQQRMQQTAHALMNTKELLFVP
ncbi:MAG: DUF1553 domain-containing protein, partial [Planctomycetota bacterium]